MSASRAPRNSPASFAQAASSSRSKGRNCQHLPTVLQSTLATFNPIIVFGEVPKFTKKDLSSVSLEESHGPFTVATTSAPRTTSPLMLSNLKSSAAGMCSCYIIIFLRKSKVSAFCIALYCL
ncbi:hypothetical protein BS47DRAFT_1401327 [Hydnum rufescens UP504]|uniref:Uncharacterized protein n=1 Tax=Hydnum rufescens UP504 TaxID=1448309 RepID=A0A9P6AF90_9AGAM|nr:hypothetical protein BS47DRAFT_1401327 [Hydnum rufescens UP504]